MGGTCAGTTPPGVTGVDDRDGMAVVEVVGEVDMAGDEPVRAMLAAQLDRRPAGLVVDLTRTDFFGSAGVQLLLEAIVRAQRPLRITLVNQVVEVYRPCETRLRRCADGVPTPRRVAHQ